MKKHSVIPLLSLIVLVFASLACGGSETPAQPEETTPPTEAPAVAPTEPPAAPSPPPATEEPAEQPQTSQGDYDTVFPLPDDVQNFMGEGGEEMVNFQTNLSLEEVVEFYRQSLTGQGLTEREILTVIEDETFSIVFDGWSNDQALVIQGVDLGETTNVNIRLEDV